MTESAEGLNRVWIQFITSVANQDPSRSEMEEMRTFYVSNAWVASSALPSKFKQLLGFVFLELSCHFHHTMSNSHETISGCYSIDVKTATFFPRRNFLTE